MFLSKPRYATVLGSVSRAQCIGVIRLRCVRFCSTQGSSSVKKFTSKDGLLKERKYVKAKTSTDHREGKLFITFLMLVVFLAGVFSWVIKGALYGDVAQCCFDTIDTRLLLIELFKANPEYPAMMIKLLWNSNCEFHFNDKNKIASTGTVDTTAPCYAYTQNLITALDKIRDEIQNTSQENSDVAQNISRSDMWAFATCVAVQHLGGPEVPFKYGRTDSDTVTGKDPTYTVESLDDVRRCFYKGAMNDVDMVVLLSLHAVGKLRGIDGARHPGAARLSSTGRISNQYFKDLLHTEWVKKGAHYVSKTDPNLVCLAVDHHLLESELTKSWCEKFSNDNSEYEFRLIEALGRLVKRNHGPWGPVPY